MLSSLSRGSGSRRNPLLSVVVPVYDVESHLYECLTGILAQPVEDLEVIVVDDGSRDRSAQLLRQFRRKDRRVRVLHQRNQGIGAARNAGVGAARGRYLTFCDADDRLPTDAWQRMLQTVQETGSDMVVGTLVRDDGKKQTIGHWMRRNHRFDRLGVDIESMPTLLADVFAVNKIFRRSFWDANDIAFPVGVRYEDQPALTTAMLQAGSIDVISDVVYHWRARADGSSITQNRQTIFDLHDRLLTKTTSTDQVRRIASRQVLDTWYRAILPVDMWEYFRCAPDAGDAYWDMLVAGVRQFWHEGTVPFEQVELPVRQRMMGWLVANDRRDDLAHLLRHIDGSEGGLAVEVGRDRVECVLPFRDRPDTPEAAYTLAPHELHLESQLLRSSFHCSTLRIGGFVAVRNVPLEDRDDELTVTLRGPRGLTLEVPARPATEPAATAAVGRRGQEYGDCGFAASIDLSVLADAGEGDWVLHADRRVGAYGGEGDFNSWHRRVMRGGTTVQGRRIRWVDGGGKLRLRVGPTVPGYQRPSPGLQTIHDAVAAYARSTPVRTIAVVGNAPMEPDEERATHIDGADLVLRVNGFVLDEPDGVRCQGSRVDVVLWNRLTRATKWFFEGYRNRLYLLVEPMRMHGNPEMWPKSWPADLGLMSMPNRDVALPLLEELGHHDWRESALAPTTGLTAAWLARTLFPEAELLMAGFSIIDNPHQTSWAHQAGDDVRVGREHRLEAEAALMRRWVDEGHARVLR